MGGNSGTAASFTPRYVTGVPSGALLKKFSDMKPGIRMHPWLAGTPGR